MATLYHLGKSLKWVHSFYVVTEEKTDELDLRNVVEILTQLERNMGSLLSLHSHG